jgi:uncharacterized protein (TIGR03083 family)
MADFAKYLPLSQRSKTDESTVSSNWREHIAATLNATADVLSTLAADQWEAPSMCRGWRVRDVAGHIVWRIGSSNRDLLASGARACLDGRFVAPSRAIDMLSRASAQADPEELVESIRSIAAAKAAGIGRHGISELTEAVVHGYDLAHPLGLTLPVDATASGAVALRRCVTAPTDIKAVLRGRTLVATDAGWRFGHGPELEGTAENLTLFLFGRHKP